MSDLTQKPDIDIDRMTDNVMDAVDGNTEAMREIARDLESYVQENWADGPVKDAYLETLREWQNIKSPVEVVRSLTDLHNAQADYETVKDDLTARNPGIPEEAIQEAFLEAHKEVIGDQLPSRAMTNEQFEELIDKTTEKVQGRYNGYIDYEYDAYFNGYYDEYEYDPFAVDSPYEIDGYAVADPVDGTPPASSVPGPSSPYDYDIQSDYVDEYEYDPAAESGGGGKSGSASADTSGADSGGGGFGCFVAGTPVLMSDGTEKPIEDVQIGDTVMAFDGLEPLTPARVVNCLVAEDREVVEVSGVRVTPLHRFLLADGSFRSIGEVTADDRLVMADGEFRSPGVIAPVAGKHTVYNLTVERLHTYVADGFRVHNIKPVVLDLDGDGTVQLVAMSASGAFFDIDNDGFRERVGWVAPSDGFLVADLDADGQITRPEELALALLTPADDTDLEALAATFDSNFDGVIDAADANFGQLKVWQDLDQDGSVDAGELRSLAAEGINSINVTRLPAGTWTDVTQMSDVELSAWGLTTEMVDLWTSDLGTTFDAGLRDDGNILFGTTQFTRADGRTGLAGDLGLRESIFGFAWDNPNGGNLTVHAESGEDVRVIASAIGVTVDLTSEGLAGIIGGVGDDHFFNTDNRGVLLFGGAGDDVLEGGGGNDWLVGSDGADNLSGGAGTDLIFFDSEDVVDGGAGSDTALLVGRGGADIDLNAVGLEAVVGSLGDDRFNAAETVVGVYLDGEFGNDTLIGSAFADYIIGGEGADNISGGGGDDILFVDAEDLETGTVSGGAGNDSLIVVSGFGVNFELGALGVETAAGGDGADVITGDVDYNVSISGGAGDDVLTGGRGHDIIAGESGADTLVGGAGDDIIDYGSSDAGVMINLRTQRGFGGHAEGDIISGFESAGGSFFDDMLTGDDIANFLSGRFGDDLIEGLGGNDILAGDQGNDWLVGGHGDDAYVVAPFDGTTVIEEGGGQGSWGTQDRVAFFGVERIADLGLRRQGTDLSFNILGGSSEGVITEQYVTASADPRVEYLKVGSGYFYRIDADMTGGATDDLIVGVDVADSMVGGAGNDVLYGNDGDDTLAGGAGRDILLGGAGADFFDGGTEVDTVSYGAAGAAVRVDLATDTTQGAAAGDSFHAVENLTGSDFGDRLTGDANANILTGRAGADVIDGGAGHDILSGGDAGLFTVRVMASADRFYRATTGVIKWPVMKVYVGDVLVGSETVTTPHNSGNWAEYNYSLYGVPWAKDVRVEFNNDQGAMALWIDEVEVNGTILAPQEALYDRYTLADIAGQSQMATNGALVFDTTELPVPDRRVDGNDTLIGGAGNDALLGRGGDDVLRGGAGGDVLIGGRGADVLDGGDGVDRVSYVDSAGGVAVRLAGDTASRASGGAAEGDTLISIEHVFGSHFADTLIGDAANNALFGDLGADFIEGGAGADVLDGGAGIDTLSYAGSARGPNAANLPGGVTVNLAAGTANFADAAGDVISGFENVIGTAYADSLTGDGNANELSGGGGADVIAGGAGDDLLDGGAGADWLDAGADVDTVSYAGSTAGIAVDLSSGETSGGDAEGDTLIGVENVTGSAHNDTLFGDSGSNILIGGAGDDVIDGGPRSVPIDGGELIIIQASHDRLIGGTGADRYIVEGGQIKRPGFLYPMIEVDSVTIDDSGDTDSTISDTLVLSTVSSLEFLSPQRVGERQGNLAIGMFVAPHLIIAGQFDPLRPDSRIEWLELEDGTTFRLQSGLVGGLDRDVIVGGDGDETLEGGAAADELYGAGGVDTATYKGSGSGVRVDLATGLALGGDAEGDILRDIENLAGSAFADELTGDPGDNVIEGGVGADVLSGGGGRDTLSYSGSALGVTVNLSNGVALGGDAAGDVIAGFELLVGSEFADVLTGDAGANTLRGGAGDDILTGGGGGDRIEGGTGNDISVFGGLFAGHQVVQRGAEITVTGVDGVDTLIEVETLRFADRDIGIGALPSGQATAISVAQSESVSGTFVQTDDVTPSAALVYAVEAGPANGALVLNSDGSYSYTPVTGYAGVDGFSYRVTDGDGLARVVDITIDVVSPDSRVGAEFRVNSYTLGDQSQSATAALPDGGFVVTWHSAAQDGSGYGIYGQRYDAAGTPVGGEFRINATTASEQTRPSITALADGGFVVTWHSHTQDGSLYGIFGQRYDAVGAAVGAEFQVNSYTPNNQLEPQIAAVSDGGFVVAWHSSGQDSSLYGIYGRHYDADGVARGPDFQIHGYVVGDQLWPSLAGLKDGGFMVAWQSAGQDSSLNGIYGQRYNASGGRIGEEFRINATTANEQQKPSLAALTDGGFVVTWHSLAQDGSSWGVYGQRYDAAGAAVGAEFQINSLTVNEQMEATVTALSDGGFVVTWHANLQDGSSWGVFGQRYDASGAKVGSEFQVNSATASEQSWPSVSALADGGFVVSWQSLNQDGSSYGVYAKVFASLSQVLEGGVGDDELVGGWGDDLVIGGAGADVLAGAAGVDTLSYVGSDAGVTVDLATGAAAGGHAAGDVFSGFENLTGSLFADTLTGDAGGNTLQGGDGNDLLTGGLGDDRLEGGSGSDIAVFSGLFADYAVLQRDADIEVAGADGTDTLSGVEVLRFADRDVPISGLPGGDGSVLSVMQGGSANGRFAQIDDLTLPDALVYGVAAGPTHGALVLNTDGSYGYTAKPGFTGTDGFSYRVTDGDGLSRVVEVAVEVVAPQVRGGAEFRVNSYTSSQQFAPTVATLSDGGFVVTWHSYAQDGSVYGIYGQRYDAAGAVSGAEFQINTTTAGEQQYPAVAALADGGFVATWQSSDGSSWGTYGQRYDASGAAVGAEFRINSFTAGEQRNAEVTGLADGGFAVTWHSYAQDGSGWGIYGQRFDAAGAAVGLEFQINSYVASEQTWPTLAGLNDGGFVATWQSYGQDSSLYGIYGQRYDAAGAAVGAEFRVNATTAGEQQNPSVTAVSDGGFVVTWQSYGKDGSGWGVYGQRYDAAGAAKGPEFRINSYTISEQAQPAVTALSDGGFVVTWMSNAQDASVYGIYGQRYDAVGTAVGSEFQINSHTADQQQLPSVSALPDGGFVVTWQSHAQDESVWGVYAKVFSSRGQVLEGDAGADVLQGGSGDDLISGGANADVLSGGEGADMLSYATSAAGVTVDLATNVVAGGHGAGDAISGFENVTGSAFADTLTGDAGGNNLHGRGGADILVGGAGDDLLDGGTGNDSLTGGEGADDLLGGTGDDTLTGGAGDDQLAGNAGNDVAIYAGLFANYQVVQQGPEITVAGPEGTDTLTDIEVLRFADRDVALSALPGGESSVISVAQGGQSSGRLVQTDDLTPAASLVYALETGPANGALVLNADGSYTYTPAAGYAGGDGFSYRVTDGDGLARVVAVAVEVVVPQVSGGEEFRVNSYTANAQSRPEMTALSDGGFVVTWQSYAQDGSVYGIYGQRYDASGTAVGAEFRVNSYVASEQQNPSVASLADGSFVVTWMSYGQDGSFWGAFGQRYDASGVPAGAEFRINSYTPNNQGETQIAALSDGGFVVTWHSYGQDGSVHGIYGQRFDAAGAAVGSEFQINSYVASEQTWPTVAGLNDGGFVATWQSYGQDGSLYGIYGQRYDVTGARAGLEFRINTTTGGEQQKPSVAGLADGGFVVTWHSLGQDGSSWGVYGQRYDAAGAAVGAEFQVSSFTANEQLVSKMTALSDGGFVVTWHSNLQDGSSWGVFGQRYDATGAAVGSEFQVNSATGSEQSWPSVSALSDGGFVVAWQSLNQDGSSYGIYAKIFSATGQVLEGGAGADTLHGGAGDDLIVGGASADTLIGGAGSDTLDYAASDAGVTVDLATGATAGGHAAGDVISGFEHVTGSAFADALTGDAAGNTLQGGVGDDVLTGGLGDDVLEGGDGNDIAVFSGLFAGYQAVLHGSEVIVTGADGTDTLTDIEILRFADRDIGPGNFPGHEGSVLSVMQSGALNGRFVQADDLTLPSALVYGIESGPANGALVLDADGSYSYTPVSGYTGEDSFSYRVTDGDGLARVVDVAVDVVAPQVSAGAEFRVNTFTANNQDQPFVAALADGGFVVTWHSSAQDGSVYGIYGQRYDATGTAVGTEFRVNTTTANEQQQPSAVGLSDGGFVVTWHSNLQDGSSWGIYGQRYDAAGAAVGPEFRANSFTANNQSQPVVAAMGNGGFVVAWHSYTQDGSGWGIYGQRYDAAGAAIGAEFRLNTYTLSEQIWPTVAAMSDGGFVATWYSSGQDSSLYGIYGQRYDALGAAVGPEFRVNATTAGDQQKPNIAALSDGGFVVTWHSNGQDGSGWGIFGQRYDAAGVTVGPEFQVNSYTASTQSEPFVTALSDGGFVVLWNSYAQDGSVYGIYGQRFDAAGTSVGPEFRVNTVTASEQVWPSVAALADGGFVVTWQTYGQDGSVYGIYAKIFSSTGQILEGGTGADALHGDSGDDLIAGGAGADTMTGGDGVDTLGYAASAAGVTISLATGVTAGGDAAGDVISGFENVIGSAFADTLSGDAGDNILTGGIGADMLAGGAGSDTLDYTGSGAGVTVDIAVNTAAGGDAAGDVIAGFENVLGTDYADTLTGNGAANLLTGYAGDDVLTGGAGDDELRGDAGNDRLDGGDGADTMIGGIGDDELTGGVGDDRIDGNAGDDRVDGGAGADILSGGAGRDTLSYTASAAGVTIDLALGTGSGGHAEGDWISGIEVVIGSAYGDSLTGDAGYNELTGGAGDDILDGGAGGDLLTGGAGADTFVFTPGGGADTVTDYDVLADKILLEGYAPTDVTVSASLADTIVDLGGGDQITLVGVAPEQLNPFDYGIG